MQKIEVKDSQYDKAKGLLLTVAIVLGGAGGTILVQATDTFQILKGVVCVGITIALVGAYRLLKPKA